MNFIKQLKDAFAKPPESGETSDENLQFAAAVLMMELSRADRDVTDVERDAVRRVIAEQFELSDEEIDELVRAAESEAEAQVSLHRYTDAINHNLGSGDKRRLVECLWRVSIAEDGIHHHEEHLVRKLADLLHVPHREFLQAKLRVQGEDAGS